MEFMSEQDEFDENEFIEFKPNLYYSFRRFFYNLKLRFRNWDSFREINNEISLRNIETYKGLIKPVLTTRDQDFALENLHTRTNNTLSGLASKLEFISDYYLLCERGLVNQDTLTSYPSLYICSGIDIELPLLMGLRNVDMLDICFKEELEKIVDRLSNYNCFERVSENEFTFKFDYGNGRETVNVSAIDESLNEFNILKKYGLVLGFLTCPYDTDNFMASDYLVNRGYFIETKPNVITDDVNIGTNKCRVYCNE